MKQSAIQAMPVALVTAGARRIGSAIVNHLHKAGYAVIIHCHQSIAEAETLAAELNQLCLNSAYVLQSDLRDLSAPAELIKNALAWRGNLNLLVNNAAIFYSTALDNFEEQSWDSLFTLNVKLPFLLSIAACPSLKASSGAIINLTDIHAHQPLKNYAVYCQTKAALTMQTKALAREFAPCVRVNAIAPGAIAWPEQENELSPALQQEIIAKTALKKHGHPDFIAQALVALALNPFITGQILKVDGGRSLGW